MAIFIMNAQIIGRSAGRTATGAAAYRAGERIVDERTGQVYDYTRRRGEIEAQIFSPAGAPTWAQDRSQLWNAAEKAERRSDAQVAREIMVALPIELSKEQQRELIAGYVQDVLKSYSAFACAKRDDSSIKCPFFMFAASRPFRSSDYEDLLTHAWVRDKVESAAKGQKYGIGSVDDDIVAELVDRLWLVVWSNHQELFCVKNPRAVVGAVEAYHKEGYDVL